jgi:ABC-type nitrate/sulfonate/bicarbonate transport system substrate-binding protein
MRPITDDADDTPAAPDPDDHVALLRAQIEAAKARRAGYREQAAETVARGGPVRPTDEELGIIKTDDTVGRIAGDASQEVRSRLSRLTSRFGRRGKK